MNGYRLLSTVVALAVLSPAGCAAPPAIVTEKIPDEKRAEQVRALRFGMFICWSFSTFSGREWTPTRDKDASYFAATGCDTDQWCRTAKAAGMTHILFLSKHHDGFCLWDTDTTEKKVTNSPLGIDVLAKLRKSCDRHGIKLALYFSEGDWNWPGAVDGKGRRSGVGKNPAMKKAQLEELCTRYGPIEYFWMDHAVGDGGLDHPATVKWVHRFQPNCFVGFNHGPAAGRLCLRERGGPGRIGDASATKYNKEAEAGFRGYLAAEFTYPILPKHRGGAQWFYSLPKHDDLCKAPEEIYADYRGAEQFENIFDIDVGPNYAGRIRKIDVETLTTVGQWIRDPSSRPPPPPKPLSEGKAAAASSEWNAPGYEAEKAVDGDPRSRWGAAPGSRSGWLQVDLGKAATIARVVILEKAFPRTRTFAVEYRDGDAWKQIAGGTTIGAEKTIDLEPVTARFVRLKILEATEVPTIEEFKVYGPAAAAD